MRSCKHCDSLKQQLQYQYKTGVARNGKSFTCKSVLRNNIIDQLAFYNSALYGNKVGYIKLYPKSIWDSCYIDSAYINLWISYTTQYNYIRYYTLLKRIHFFIGTILSRVMAMANSSIQLVQYASHIILTNFSVSYLTIK